MALNIDDQQSDVAGPPDSRPLVDEVVAELSSWNPRQFLGAFRRWHHGNVSLVHLNVLALLEGQGPLSMSGLADAVDISVASMTGVIDRMEKRGLVERRHDADYRRVVLVHEAEGGHDLFLDLDVHRRTTLAELLTQLSDEELTGLLRGYRALRSARQAFVERRETGGPTTTPAAETGTQL